MASNIQILPLNTTLVKHDYHFFYAAENYGLVQIVARQR